MVKWQPECERSFLLAFFPTKAAQGNSFLWCVYFVGLRHYFSFGWVRYWVFVDSLPCPSTQPSVLHIIYIYIRFPLWLDRLSDVIVNWLYYHYWCATHSIGILNATAKSPQIKIKNQSKILIQFVPNAQTLRRRWRFICRRSFPVKVLSLL